MKKLSFALALGLMAFVSNAFADVECPPGQFLKKIGAAQTASAVVSTQGEDVRAVSVQCGLTACVAGLYDTTTTEDATATTLVLDIGAAASGTILFPETGFLSTPLRFKSGLVFIDNGNVNQITFLGCST